MARYYRRRYTRVVRPKKKWASNISTFNNLPAVIGTDGFGYTILVTNSLQSASPTPSIIKAGNFKISIDSYLDFAEATVAGTAVVQFFIVYLPEAWGTAALGNLITSHPEWILASKTVGSSEAIGNKMDLETINLSTRLKRNLNSGDSILLVFQINPAVLVNDTKLKLTGHVRYWTCAN